MAEHRGLCSIGICWNRAIGLQSICLSQGLLTAQKKSYEQAFLHAEADEMDIGYFIANNQRVLQLAFDDLKSYLQINMEERQVAVVHSHLLTRLIAHAAVAWLVTCTHICCTQQRHSGHDTKHQRCIHNLQFLCSTSVVRIETCRLRFLMVQSYTKDMSHTMFFP